MSAASPRPCIVFSHGNSFPAGTYSVVFQALRERGYRVTAVERYGHDPRYPVTRHWPHLVYCSPCSADCQRHLPVSPF